MTDDLDVSNRLVGAGDADRRDVEHPGLPTSVLFDVFALSHAVGRLLADALSDGPLTPTEYAVYSAIFELETASPTQLSNRLGMHLTTFMDQLRRIEDLGHSTRMVHPTDRRSYLVTLTASGRAAHRAANHQFERANAAFVAALHDGGHDGGHDGENSGEASAKAALHALRTAADRARTDTGASLDDVSSVT